MPRRLRLAAALAGIALLTAASAVAGVFDLRPPPPEKPWAPLTGQDLWPQIDDLEDDLGQGDAQQQAERHVLLAYSYAALSGPEHRNTALDHLRTAYALDSQRTEILESRGLLLHEMGYIHESTSLLNDVARAHPDRFRAHYARGWVHLVEGFVVLDAEHLLAALEAFQHCTRLSPESAKAWHARAVAALVARDLGDAAAAAERACQLNPDWTHVHLLAGAAHGGLGNASRAAFSFERGLANEKPSVRQTFDSGEFRETATVAFDLSQPVNAQALSAVPGQDHELLTFRRRLVEADLLFGGLSGEHGGWETAPGKSWVRWGRPADTRYDGPDFEDIDWGEVAAAGGGPQSATANRRQPRGYRVDMNHATQRWHWVYPGAEGPVVFTFVDITRHRRWTVSDATGIAMAALEKSQPYVLPKNPPKPQFNVLASGAGFYDEKNRPRLELYLEVQRDAESSLAADVPVVRVDWSALTPDGTVVASGAHDLTKQHSYEGSPLLAVVDHSFKPGQYRIQLHTTDMAAGGQRTVEMDVGLSPPSEALSLSGIQLARSFHRNEEDDVPDEFVKHDFVVAPRPSGAYGPGDPMYVYFEVYNLGVNSQQQTHFDVSYRVFSQDDVPTPDALFAQNSEIEPLAMTFVSEKTGVSAQGHVVKGSQIDIGTLDPGNYVLNVTVEDRLGDALAMGSVAFRKTP